MDAITILRLGAVMLGFGSIGLFIVRSTNYRLRGLGWLGASFALGSLSAALLVTHVPHALSVLGSDACLLVGFALLHVAVMDLMTQRPKVEWASVVLIVLLLLVDTLRLAGRVSGDTRIGVLSLLVAIQCTLSVMVLNRTARPAERIPALFCRAVLSFFALYNVVRCFVALTGMTREPLWYSYAVTGGFALYIAVALGLAFGFFWMSTVQLSIQLEHIAGTDPLTRLYNRRTFLKACEKEMITSREKVRPFSVLMMDIDHFKAINDRFGHQAGDDALVAAVESMQSATRGSDILARWGGEEFAALLPNATLEAAMIVAERIRQNVERLRLMVRHEGLEIPLRMTVSVGVATCAEHDTIQSIMGRSDRGLYAAKDSGRNRAASVQQDSPEAAPAASVTKVTSSVAA